MPNTRSPGAQAPFNDAHLIQLVRGALGRTKWAKGLSRINVSSCKFIITLHGIVPDSEARIVIETAVRQVPGVRDVVNKLGISQDGVASVFPQTDFGVSDLVDYSKIPG